METPESPKHSSVLWGFDEPEPVLSGVPVDGEW